MVGFFSVGRVFQRGKPFVAAFERGYSVAH